jgi:hypothetical protein
MDQSMPDATPSPIYYVCESVWQSFVKDAISFVTVVGIIGVGKLVDSAAMEWMGAGMTVWFFILQVRGTARKLRTTPQEAADRLLREHGVTGRNEAA